MNILAFDTCFNACSVAVDCNVSGHDRTIWSEKQLMTTGHAEALLPMIARVMGTAGIEYSEIDRIAVTHGPGTFTGTRIGISAARALSLALGVPIVRFSSLLPIGKSATSRIPDCIGDRDAVIVARDARRDQCYVEIVDVWGKSLTGPLLPPGHQSLGIHLDVSHTAATPVGHRVVAEAEIIAVDGRTVTLRVTARDPFEVIGGGTHKRVVVNVDRFDKRLQAKLPRPA